MFHGIRLAPILFKDLIVSDMKFQEPKNLKFKLDPRGWTKHELIFSRILQPSGTIQFYSNVIVEVKSFTM